MKKAFIPLTILFVIGLFSVHEALPRGFGGGRSFGASDFRGGGSWGGGGFGNDWSRGDTFDRSSSWSGDEFNTSRHENWRRNDNFTTRSNPERISRRQSPELMRMPAEAAPSRSELEKFLNMPIQKDSVASGIVKRGALEGSGPGKLREGDSPAIDGRRGASERTEAGHRQIAGNAQRGDRIPNADQIRNNFENNSKHVFTPQWWRDHPNLARQYWRNDDGHPYPWNHWWRAAAWGALAGWVAGGSSWSTPQYYDYGSGIYYDGDTVYSEGQAVASTQEYYQQAKEIASKPPDPEEPSKDLLSLGVFALSKQGLTASNMFVQLAVDKEGRIVGTYYNSSTDTSSEVTGSVDKQSQRAAWTFSDGKNNDIVMETGIYNLTQDQTEALVHFGKDITQKWLMVRLKQPEKQGPGETYPGKLIACAKRILNEFRSKYIAFCHWPVFRNVALP